MRPTLRTSRLLLAPLEDRDLNANPVPLQTVAEVIARSSHTFQTSGQGLWSLRLTADSPLMGVCGRSPFEHGEGVELLYSLTPSLRLLTRLGATPAPRLQVGPNTYPCFTIRPRPAPSRPVAQWIEQRTSNSSGPVQARPSPSISPGQRLAPVRRRPSQTSLVRAVGSQFGSQPAMIQLLAGKVGTITSGGGPALQPRYGSDQWWRASRFPRDRQGPTGPDSG
jgi:hypothetical protein